MHMSTYAHMYARPHVCTPTYMHAHISAQPLIICTGTRTRPYAPAYTHDLHQARRWQPRWLLASSSTSSLLGSRASPATVPPTAFSTRLLPPPPSPPPPSLSPPPSPQHASARAARTCAMAAPASRRRAGGGRRCIEVRTPTRSASIPHTNSSGRAFIVYRRGVGRVYKI